MTQDIWIKASEKKPECHMPVLVFIPEEDNYIAMGVFNTNNTWTIFNRLAKEPVTHWMYLPSQPTN